MRSFLLILLLFAGISALAQNKTLLAIFPHPDDESAIGEVLVKYARMGYRVQLVIATDGKDGTRVTSIPAGDSLGALRKEESRCACRVLGIDPPIFLGIDRLDTRIGVGNYFREHNRFLDTLKQVIPAIDPAFIITFGPDGDTHHAEHIVTGAAVTELLLRENWVDRYPLYYLSWTKTQGETFRLGYMDESFFNVKVAYSQEQEDTALQIMPCYSTQFIPSEITDDRNTKCADTNHAIHFRRFVVQKGMREDF